MTMFKDQVATEATTAEREWSDVVGAAMAAVANCVTRREPRLLAREMCEAMLMELDTRICWTLAEALGHCSYRLQHFLARAHVDIAAGLRTTALRPYERALTILGLN
ncbi:hypothetical protein [Streptomyces coelicoflavus]|uniref:hypothetical protein n=1 Tax=Streptomyces coelicoflavus TaxID=285562 RepID=UPI0036764E59